MGRSVDIPLLRGTTYHGYGGQNGMGMGFDKPWTGVENTMGTGVSKYPG